MHRHTRSTLTPWVESLILNYGSEEGGSSSSSGRLKAHVIGVGQMSQSQAQGSEGPTGLLFLSDGVLQIPAILAAPAWEHLQEQEDRECFTSLVNTTVWIRDYRLQFHMTLEQTKCRFFLSVGELATTAAGPVKHNTPCSTTQPSIRLKICKTWRALLGQETQNSQKSQCGFDLSELLGEWRHDCLQSVLEDVRQRLMVASRRPMSLEPSTSTHNSSPTHPDTFTATSWDVDRVSYKGVKCFSVPIKYLLIPEEIAQQLQTPQNVGCRTTSGLSAVSENRKTTLFSVDDAEWRIAVPAVAPRDQDTNENSPHPVEDSTLHEDMVTTTIDSDIEPLSNPWDIFPPPCVNSSSSDASPEETLTQSLHNPTAAESKSNRSVILTSTQLPVESWKESWHTLEPSKEEHSCLPPYQRLPISPSLPATAGSRRSNLLPATDEHRTDAARQNLPASDQESQVLVKDMEGTVERKYRKAKRKRSGPTPEALTTLAEEEEEQAQISGSPPSWLFDTQAPEPNEGSSHKQGHTVGIVLRKSPAVHSDGRPFSYSYQRSGQNLQDFSHFKVSESLLHWAVKYLVVPKQTDNPHNTSLTSNQTSADKTVSLTLGSDC